MWLRPSNCSANTNSISCTYPVLRKHGRARNSVRRTAPRLPHTLCTLHSHADVSDGHPYSTARCLSILTPPPNIQMLSYTFTDNRQPTNKLPSSIPSRGLLGIPQNTDTTRSASGLPVAHWSIQHTFLNTQSRLNLSLNRDLPAYYNTARRRVAYRHLIPFVGKILCSYVLARLLHSPLHRPASASSHRHSTTMH